MKTTLELPDDLVNEIKLLALHEGKQLQDAVTDLLRQGLAALGESNGTTAPMDAVILQQRAALTEKFVSGEWGTELTGFEESRDADRQQAEFRAKEWRN